MRHPDGLLPVPAHPGDFEIRLFFEQRAQAVLTTS